MDDWYEEPMNEGESRGLVDMYEDVNDRPLPSCRHAVTSSASASARLRMISTPHATGSVKRSG